MEHPSLFVAGFDDPLDDPKAHPWLERAQALVPLFTRDVHGDAGVEECCEECGFHPVNSIVVHIAASEIWRRSGGQPCWSKLDVAAFARQVAASPLATMTDDVMVTLHAFYTFLWLHGHVSPRKVEHILGALDLHTASVAARLGLAASVDWGPN